MDDTNSHLRKVDQEIQRIVQQFGLTTSLPASLSPKGALAKQDGERLMAAFWWKTLGESLFTRNAPSMTDRLKKTVKVLEQGKKGQRAQHDLQVTLEGLGKRPESYNCSSWENPDHLEQPGA